MISNNNKFKFYKQLNASDCGPTCLRMVANYYGKNYYLHTLRQTTGFSKSGVSMLGISEAAEKIGFRATALKLTMNQLERAVFPCILHWDQNHFVVLLSLSGTRAKIADPANGILTYTQHEFFSHWISSKSQNNEQAGITLLLEPTASFWASNEEKQQQLGWKLVLQYLEKCKWQIGQIFAALIFASLIQLIFPLLTQRIVDIGIKNQNLQYVTLVLIAQLMLTFSKTIVDFVRSRLILRISNVLNLQILSDFWMKITKLPLSYFDSHHIGDLLQRIADSKQIQNFLTGSALNTLFSILSFIVYAVVLILYSVKLFFIFLIGTVIYFTWIQFFLNIRRKINYETFHLSARENNATLQLIQGIQEIRLNNAEKQKREEWQNIQAGVFKLNFKNLNYNQWQQAGATFINNVQSLAITFIVAKLVIDGQLTIGAMLAVQYIVGQLSGPVNQWVSFIEGAQDAKISMERLNEIHQMDGEEDPNKVYNHQFPEDKSILLEHLSFTYPGAGNEPVLDDINLFIPEGKVTAVVGVSGSGKTTLLKLLLGVYDKYEGRIMIGVGNNVLEHLESKKKVFFAPLSDNSQFISGNCNSGEQAGISFDKIRPSEWRLMCGVVMQDGYIFNDTIARNIAVGQNDIDNSRLLSSCEIANILNFIESLPNGFETEIGGEGVGLSQGQKQRLLIARAVYKNPKYLFFDEATNSLDSNNEKEIVENLNKFFENKTVVVVAHRLSTIRNSDKIVVLSKGRIAEQGTHDGLLKLKGKYYELVKNQLELGNLAM